MDELIDNLVTFFMFSVIHTMLSFIYPPKWLNPRNRYFRDRRWEQKGNFYQRIFRVKFWKDSLPELSDYIKKIFRKKHILTLEPEYLQLYITETCRAELTHLCIIATAFLFHLWADFSVSMTVIYLSIILNTPFIIIQRYNRPRILKLLDRKHIFAGVKTEDLLF
ncbi:MAG: hypothetical protein LBQ68_06665 [Clostridiales bacterium]|nr:hypothetical protein [Clostridiales bacterium]